MRSMHWMAGLVAGFTIVSVGWACGDKLSAMGGGVRFDRIVQSRTSGHVIVYAPQNSRLDAANDDLRLAGELERAGHSVHVVRQADELKRMLSSSETDLVLADFSDFGHVSAERKAGGGTAAILPVAYELSGESPSAEQPTSSCVAHVTKRTSRKLVRAVGAILERRSRGLPFDCGNAS